MAEDIEGGGEAAKPPEAGQPNSGARGGARADLPAVDSPSLSPANDEPEVIPDTAIMLLPPARENGARSAGPRLRPRHRRQAILAVTVAIAAALGAVAGAVATGGKSAPPAGSAAIHEQQALQQSVTRLNKEVASLKASLAASRKSAKSEIAKISDRLADRLRSAPDITGSIAKPPSAIPTPPPRPPRPPLLPLRAAANRVVPGWTIDDVYRGYVYVRAGGDVYQVVPGARLPGLGPVQHIERRDGRWVVVTPRGLIVASRDRAHFARE